MGKSKWSLDLSHCSLDFSLKHMMISTVRGTFQQFEADIDADPTDLTTADVTFTIDASSIDTRDANRNEHLKSADFFEVEKYPHITFHKTSIARTSDDEYTMTGDLSMHGVTQPVTFRVTAEGQGKDPWGNERAGFSAETSINRKDYGLHWNAMLETGGVLVGEQVKIALHLSAVKQA